MGATRTPDKNIDLQLDLDKKNVFVTQLHQRDDDDSSHRTRRFPVVKECGSKLIETGLRTLQKTLILKKEVEVEQVDVELAQKQQEFQQRMAMCAERKIELEKREQEMQERVVKFDKFIKENDAKRYRAVEKYHNELKLKEQKRVEYEALRNQLDQVIHRRAYLAEKISDYKVYETYLLEVIDVLPEDYLPASDDKLKGLMMRHRTLQDSNRTLIENLEQIGDELKEHREKLEALSQEHDKQKVSISSELARLQKFLEQKQEKNFELDQKYSMSKGELRQKRMELGEVYMAIENITQKCHKNIDEPLEQLNLDEKLLKILNFMNDREDVVALVAPGCESARSSAKGSVFDAKQFISTLGRSRQSLPRLK